VSTAATTPSDEEGDAAPEAPAGLQTAPTGAPVEPSATGKHAAARASRPGSAEAVQKSDESAARLDPSSLPSTATSTDVPDAIQVSSQSTDRIATTSTAAAAAGAAATAPSLPTAVPVAGLAVAIAAQSQAGNSRFEIRLDPPELGRIDVRLDVDRNGHVTSRLMVEKAETLDLLRRDAPQLERALQQAGLKTGDSSLQFTLRDQSFGGQNQDSSGNARSARLVVTDGATAAIDAASSSYGRPLRLGGGVDIRV
jgi:flagellar hook-length control protein FliK